MSKQNSIIWSCETIDIDLYEHIPSRLANFFSLRISTVTGQVSIMPQTAVYYDWSKMMIYLHSYLQTRCSRAVVLAALLLINSKIQSVILILKNLQIPSLPNHKSSRDLINKAALSCLLPDTLTDVPMYVVCCPRVPRCNYHDALFPGENNKKSTLHQIQTSLEIYMFSKCVDRHLRQINLLSS